MHSYSAHAEEMTFWFWRNSAEDPSTEQGFEDTSTIKDHALRIQTATFEAVMNLGWGSQAKATINLLLNWVCISVPAWTTSSSIRQRTRKISSCAAFSMLSTANFKKRDTLKSAACFEPLPCPYCKDKLVQ